MDTFLLKNLSDLLQTGIFYIRKNEPDDRRKIIESNHICQDASLRDMLVHAADMQTLPYLYQDEFQVYFGCVAAGDGHCLVGPMSVDFFDRLKHHKFYRKYQIPEASEKNLQRRDGRNEERADRSDAYSLGKICENRRAGFGELAEV